MMEHLETKRGTSPKTEVGQPLVKNPKEPAWTLIGAIEQIVNLAIELKLETPFSEKAHSALTYVSECMSLDEEHALAFALFMEKSTDPRIQISDFSDLIGCRTVRIISLMAAADRLAQRHLIWRFKKENTLFYSVPMEVVEAVKENRAFEPAPIDNLTVEQLFDRMEKILDRMKEDRNLLLADLDALVAANPELPFCQTLQIYDLSEDVERLLFYVFCHLYVNKGKAYLRMRDWQDYFTGDEQRFLSWMMNASDLKLCERKIIEPYNANGLEDPEYFHLTRTAREALFVGLRYVEHKSRKGGIYSTARPLPPRSSSTTRRCSDRSTGWGNSSPPNTSPTSSSGWRPAACARALPVFSMASRERARPRRFTSWHAARAAI